MPLSFFVFFGDCGFSRFNIVTVLFNIVFQNPQGIRVERWGNLNTNEGLRFLL